jgi:hypothetical protein
MRLPALGGRLRLDYIFDPLRPHRRRAAIFWPEACPQAPKAFSSRNNLLCVKRESLILYTSEEQFMASDSTNSQDKQLPAIPLDLRKPLSYSPP